MNGGPGLPDWLRHGAQSYFLLQHSLKVLLIQLFSVPILVMYLKFQQEMGPLLLWAAIFITVTTPVIVMIVFMRKAGNSLKYWQGFLRCYIDQHKRKIYKTEEDKQSIEIATQYLEGIS